MKKINIESLSGQTLFVGIDVYKKTFHVTLRSFDKRGQVFFCFKEKPYRKNRGNGFPRVPLVKLPFPQGQRAMPVCYSTPLYRQTKGGGNR